MFTWRRSFCLVIVFCVCVGIPEFGFPVRGLAVAAEPTDVDFSRDVLPILSRNCFTCHGPDEGSREADLRLDRADAVLAETSGGPAVVVPGQPLESELFLRVSSDAEDLVMPPVSAGSRLTDSQINTLRVWIQQGGKFDDHWSLRPLQNDPPPVVPQDDWVRNPIDRFVLAKLQHSGLTPSPEADRHTLIRRLSLDLRGLPPTPEEIRQFVVDTAPDAYSQLVERLLASPHFGERWARPWLDLAHYADSDGYLGDAFRPHAWVYRDWVIAAINQDLPFDQFTIEQLAGDLLPDAQLSQRTATGFLRNTLRNTEAGVDLEEYRLQEIVDRVNTVGVGWLGLSLGCAECHSHKYDPISQREFYQIFAFFNDADDVDLPAPQPDELRQHQLTLVAWTQRRETLSESISAQWDLRCEDLSEPTLQQFLGGLAEDPQKQSADTKQAVATVLAKMDSQFEKLCEQYQKHLQAKPKPPATKAMTVARRKQPRVSYVHLRGDYRSRGPEVQPGTPAVLPPLRSRGQVPDRLDFARWLVAADNPLTPRVAVNQVWQQLLGRGLVASTDNFGAAGETPSHPDLLDWLGGEYVRHGWSRKALIRKIVHSATYRQVAAQRPELQQVDPENVLLARQARFRVDAENIRDVALSAAGLLEHTIGGPSIRPPQPAYIASISRNTQWKASTGPELYRRGLYILFRRATPYPMLTTFDAPESTTVCVRRERSNSPLQALTLLNDPVFFEAAQALGVQLASQPAQTVQQRLDDAFQRCVGRQPNQEERERLRLFWNERVAAYQDDPATAAKILPSEKKRMPNGIQRPEGVDPAEQAAWVLTARVLMNLDLFLTRE